MMKIERPFEGGKRDSGLVPLSSFGLVPLSSFQFVGFAKRPQLPLPEGLLEGELVPSQHVDVVKQQR